MLSAFRLYELIVDQKCPTNFIHLINNHLIKEYDNFKEIYEQVFYLLIEESKKATILTNASVYADAINVLLRDRVELVRIFTTPTYKPWIPGY